MSMRYHICQISEMSGQYETVECTATRDFAVIRAVKLAKETSRITRVFDKLGLPAKSIGVVDPFKSLRFVWDPTIKGEYA